MKNIIFLLLLSFSATCQERIYLRDGVYISSALISANRCPCDGDNIPPTITFGIAAGTATLISIVGDNKKGIITFKTGTGAGLGKLLTVTFPYTYISPVVAQIAPVDDNAVMYFYAQGYYAKTWFSNHFDIYNYSLASPIPAGIEISISYIVQK